MLSRPLGAGKRTTFTYRYRRMGGLRYPFALLVPVFPPSNLSTCTVWPMHAGIWLDLLAHRPPNVAPPRPFAVDAITDGHKQGKPFMSARLFVTNGRRNHKSPSPFPGTPPPIVTEWSVPQVLGRSATTADVFSFLIRQQRKP